MTMPFVRRVLLPMVAFMLIGCAGAAGPASPSTASPAPPFASPPLAVTPSAAATPTAVPTPATAAGEPWIVYQGGTGGPARIRLVRPDGTGDHELTPGQAPGEQFHPDWSRDGSRIAFAVDPGDGMRDIWVANADGTRVELVFDCVAPCGWADDPAWSPDGRSLLFQVARGTDDDGTGVSQLDVLDLETREQRTAFSAPPTEYLYVPRWSPDGTALVVETVRFASALLAEEQTVGGTVGIVDLAPESPAFRPLLDWDSRASYPDWSPDGRTVVFQRPTSPGSDPADLHVITVDGTGERTLTDFGPAGGWAIQPSWTPDGARIIFVGEDTVRTKANAAFVATDGTGLERMPWDGTFRTHPRLRPLPAD